MGSILDALRSRKRDRIDTGREGSMTQAATSKPSNLDQRQRDVRTVVGFKPILGYVDMHQRDGYPDVALSAFGSRYQLVQMLSLRDPVDGVWLNDTLAGEMPYWLRTNANVHEEQRMAHSPSSPASAYQLQDWHEQAYAGVPTIGGGPGTILMRDIPMSQAAD